MIITTLQELALVSSCCDCEWPTCDAPSLSCQSIAIEACGYSLPDHPDLSVEDACKLYKTKANGYDLFSSENRYDLIGYEEYLTGVQDITNNTTATVEKYYVGTTCNAHFINTSHYYSNVFQHFPYDEGEEDFTDTDTIISSSTLSGGCIGTRTWNEDPPEEFNSCPTYNPDPDETWIYTAPGTYTKSLTGDVPPDYTESEDLTVTYSNQITITDLTEHLVTLAWDEDTNGQECISSVTAAGLSGCEQVTSATRVRYQVGIPETESYRGYDAAHAAWTEADPEERGPEPRERSVYIMEWDLVFFPKDLLDWQILKADYDSATASLSSWSSCESETPGECGDAPEVPANPGNDPPSEPVLVGSEDWTYSGGDGWSSWFEMPLPEEPGEIRIVNTMVKCWNSVRLGSKPQSFGEIVDLE
jgi:hypothetical protein